MLITQFFDNPLTVGLYIIAVIIALTIHEAAHAVSAYLQGDHTAEDAGRLNLNPLAHIDLVGFALFLLAGFGWAKPTPFNPYNLKNQRFGPVLVALAGPAINIIFAIIAIYASKFLVDWQIVSDTNLLPFFCQLLFIVNLSLAIFNFLPIPPLDGSRVLYALIIDKRPDVVMWLERYGFFILIGVFVFFEPYIEWVIMVAHAAILSFVF